MPQTSILKNRCISAVKKMTYTKHERWSHNESERRLNARGYIGPLAEYSFFYCVAFMWSMQWVVAG